jgi:two-component system response regulator DesR
VTFLPSAAAACSLSRTARSVRPSGALVTMCTTQYTHTQMAGRQPRTLPAEDGGWGKLVTESDLSLLPPGTVRNYLSSAAAKLRAASRHEAVQLARSRGWI